MHTEHEMIYSKGREVYINKGEKLMVAVSLKETGWGIHVDFKIKNGSNEMVNVLLENFSAFQVARKGELKPLEVYSHDKMRDKRYKYLKWYGPSNVSHMNLHSKTNISDATGRIIGSLNTNSSSGVYTGALDKAYDEVDSMMESYFQNETLSPDEEMDFFIVCKKLKNKLKKNNDDVYGIDRRNNTGIYIFRFENGNDIFEYKIDVNKD